MQTTLFLTSLLLWPASNAQAPSNLNVDSLLTCQTGYKPTLSCKDPAPIDEQCICTCQDGAKFNQTRPGLTGSIPIPLIPGGPGDGTLIPHKPCTTEIIQPWIQISMPHKAHTFEPSAVSSNYVNVPEDSVLLVADARQRCQNFVVFIDDVRVGVTSGTGPLDGEWCGEFGEECIEKYGGSHAYFTLAKGRRKIGLQWIDVPEACKHYSEAVGSFQVYKPCDSIV